MEKLIQNDPNRKGPNGEKSKETKEVVIEEDIVLNDDVFENLQEIIREIEDDKNDFFNEEKEEEDEEDDLSDEYDFYDFHEDDE